MMTDAEIFVGGVLAQSKALSMEESLRFLHGFLQVAVGTVAENAARRAYAAVRECDQQLELIASGQIRLDLADRETITKKRGRK